MIPLHILQDYDISMCEHGEIYAEITPGSQCITTGPHGEEDNYLSCSEGDNYRTQITISRITLAHYYAHSSRYQWSIPK